MSVYSLDDQTAIYDLVDQLCPSFRRAGTVRDFIGTKSDSKSSSSGSGDFLHDGRGEDQPSPGCHAVHEGGGLDWLWRTFPSCSKSGTSEEKAQGEPQPMYRNFLPPGLCQSRVRFGHDDRGCERGLCCVYSMWFDPEFVHSGSCVHRCVFSLGRFPTCGPSLLEDSTLGREYHEFAG